MRILMLDDSYDYDGDTPVKKPIGGAEKAFVHLAAAFASRGHDVTAINRCSEQKKVKDVLWLPFASPRPPETDILIAFRKPALLQEQDDAGQRILWNWGSPKSLNQPANQALLEKYNPNIVFVGDAQRKAWKSWRDFKEKSIMPGLAETYVQDMTTAPDDLPIAVTTTHPLHDLEAILDLWRNRIRQENQRAELHIFSASLVNGAAGAGVEDRIKSVLEKAMSAKAAGVRLKKPLADTDMAAVYRSARVHLYPVIRNEYYCSTLAESQSSGLPAVVGQFNRRLGDTDLAPILERVQNGLTGYVAPDDDAFVNLTLELLDGDKTMFESLSRDARTLQSGRDWQAAAIEFESLFI